MTEEKAAVAAYNREDIKREIMQRAHALKKRSDCMELTDPDMAVELLERKAAGESWNQIYKETGKGFGALSTLFNTHGETISELRIKMAPKLLRAAELFSDLCVRKAEMLMEDGEKGLREVNMRELSISAAIFQDKGLAAAGVANVVVEHRKGASMEDAKALIDAAKRRIASKDGPVIDAEYVAVETAPNP